jgi:hypothetical protein
VGEKGWGSVLISVSWEPFRGLRYLVHNTYG